MGVKPRRSRGGGVLPAPKRVCAGAGPRPLSKDREAEGDRSSSQVEGPALR